MKKRFQLLNRLHLWLLPVACLIELPGILHSKTCTLLRSLPGLIALREQTAGKGIIADDSYALINRQREQLSVNMAEEYGVPWLHPIKTPQPEFVPCPQGFAHLPGGKIRASTIR